MTDYYIDFNRGLDSNNGVSAPWKNLSMININLQSLAAGSTINLANDSTWRLNTSFAESIATNNWNATEASPILVRGYDAGGGSGAYPIVEKWYEPLAADWTWDAVASQWYYSDGATNIGFMPLLMYGTPLVYGTQNEPGQSKSSLVADGDYIVDGTKIYLYSPPGTDPTTYYGVVRISPQGKAAFFSAWHYWNHVHFEDIKFQYTATGIRLLGGTSGGTRYIRANGLQGYHAQVLSASTSAGVIYDIVAENLHCEYAPCAMATAFEYLTNDTYQQFLVKDSYFSHSSQAYSQGAIYCQAYNMKVVNNEIAYAGGSTKFKTFDGCGVYAEVESNNTVISGNYIHHSHRAIQDNSGRNCNIYGNVIDTCGMGAVVSDASSVGATNHLFVNNTLVNMGVTDYRGPAGAIECAWYEGVTGGTFNVHNNIMLGADGAVQAVRNGSSGFTTNLVRGFTSTGLSGDIGTLTTDPLLSAGYKPSSASPCIGAGTYTLPGATDFRGLAFRHDGPTIGAFEMRPKVMLVE